MGNVDIQAAARRHGTAVHKARNMEEEEQQ